MSEQLPEYRDENAQLAGLIGVIGAMGVEIATPSPDAPYDAQQSHIHALNHKLDAIQQAPVTLKAVGVQLTKAQKVQVFTGYDVLENKIGIVSQQHPLYVPHGELFGAALGVAFAGGVLVSAISTGVRRRLYRAERRRDAMFQSLASEIVSESSRRTALS
ncbi:MAG TPA: hypothetical protein VIJ68_02110 [Candidatus Saccharimonadales bacterium]